MTQHNRAFRLAALCCFFALFWASARTLPAQQMQAQVVAQPLQSPYLNDYERMPGAIIITVVNPSPQEMRFKISGSLKLLRQNRIVVATRDQLTREFVAPPGGSVTVQAPEFLDRSSLSIAREDEANVLRTGRIPEGEYELCVKITDPQNPNRLLTPPIPCRRFRAQTPQPPRLLSPANASTPTQAYPVFSWTASLFVSGRTAQYVLTVAKILQGQTPRQALESNIPLVRTEPLPSASFTYPATAEQFDQITDAVGYVWQVQAVDENGVPVGENDGKSEIFTFLPPAIKQGGSGLISGAAANAENAANQTPKGDFPTTEISGAARLKIGAAQLGGEKIQVSLLAASAQNRVVASTETDPQTGAFVLRNVSLGDDSYSILLRARGGLAEKTYPIGRIAVGERKENLNLSLELPSYQARLTIADDAGKPVAGAVVSVSRASGSFAFGGEPALNARATSDANGGVTLNGLIVAESVQDFYVLTVKAAGYKTAKTYLRQTSSGLATEQIRLERAGMRFTGFVRQSNEVVANAAVYLLSGEKIIAQSVSDNDGSFTLEAPASLAWGLSASERQNLRAYAARGGSLRGDPVPARIAAGEESAELNLSLPDATVAFSGVVQTQTQTGARAVNAPLAGAIVRDLRTGSSVTTDGAGRFTLQSSGEQIRVAVSRAGFEDAEVQLKAGANEITLKAQGAWIELVVRDAKSNKPIAKASVVLIDSAGAAQTDASGVAVLRDFPQYARSLTVFASGYAAETLDFLPSNGRVAERIEVQLKAGGAATGVVKDASGKPLANASVALAGYENTLEVKTGADGKYRLDYLPAGDARLVARAAGFLSSASDVVIELGKARAANFSLKQSPAPIRSLAGFEARIDDLKEDGDAYRISGVLTDLKPSKLFASLVSTARFQNVRVSKASAQNGNALPPDGKFSLVERELPMKFADEFPVKAKASAGADGLTISLESPDATQGALKAAVQWQFADYVNDVAAGAAANVEEVQILFARPLLGKDGAAQTLYEEHEVLTAAAFSLQSEENEYKAACEKAPTITVGGVTLAMKCDNFTIDAGGGSASFGALATLPENPLGLDTLTINPVKMSRASGFQSADIQFAPALSIPLASTGWAMDITALALSNTGVKIAGTLTVGVAASLPLKGVSFTDLGVAVGGVSGGVFSTSPAEFDVYGITTITVPQLSVAIAGDSITVKVSNGKISLKDADWSNLNIPTFQFTRRLDNLRKIPNLPAFKTPSVNMPANNLRRPSFPGLGKIAASLKGIVSVELTNIEVNDQSQLAIDGSVAFQFPSLQVQAGNFTFGKNTFIVRKFGFRLDNGALNAGMNIEFTPENKTASPPTKARFNGDATVEIKKGGSVFIGLAAAVMYESSQVWSVDFVANIPPIQLVPAPPPGVPIYLSGFGGGIERSNNDYRLSLQCTLQNAPTRPAPMDVTLGVTVWTTGVVTGSALMNVMGEKLGDGTVTVDVGTRDATGTINLGMTKGGVTAKGSVNFGVWTSKKGDYFVDATTQLTIPTLLTANGRFYYGVETRSETRTVTRKVTVLPQPAPNTPASAVQELKTIGEALDKLNSIIEEYYYYRKDVAVTGGPLRTIQATYPLMLRNTAGFYVLADLGNYTLDRVNEVLQNMPQKTASKTTLLSGEAQQIARATLKETIETPKVNFPYTRFQGQFSMTNAKTYSFANEDEKKISVPIDHNFVAMLFGSPHTSSIMVQPQSSSQQFSDGFVKAIGEFEKANPKVAAPGVPSLISGEPFDKGRRAYADIVGRMAEVFWLAGISPRDVTTKDSTFNETVDFKDGKMIIDVTAKIADQNKSISFGNLGSVSFYGNGDGRFYLETAKDFKSGSGRLNFQGGTGFNVRVIKITISGDATLRGNFALSYNPSATTFQGAMSATMNATAIADGCCRTCTPDCNDYCTRFLYGAVKACIGVNANASYSNKQFSFDIARR